jgi:hypothetical protein
MLVIITITAIIVYLIAINVGFNIQNNSSKNCINEFLGRNNMHFHVPLSVGDSDEGFH